MSLQAALQFIQTIRQDESLRNQIERDGQQISFSNVVALGNETALAFTADELRTAEKLIGRCAGYATGPVIPKGVHCENS